MKTILRYIFILIFITCSLSSFAQINNQKNEYSDFENDSLYLENVEVSAQNGSRIRRDITSNTELIGAAQLVRAACCNLGESFTTNPSVDVSYSDAATGAKQIKLLGLSGTYVQMLTENVPNLRGASIPYSLGYVPGPWMQAIQVSKGASSVKNGYESTTGQINIEYLKPQGVDGVRGNIYYDTQQKLEANVDGSIHLTDKLSTSLLLHYEDRQMDHDGNGDGFMDMPKIRQYNIMDRWAYVSPKFISQLFVRALNDERESGQSMHASMASSKRYDVSVKTNRYELQWKNAIITNPDKNASVALMLHGSYHDADNVFGQRLYDVNQKNGYAQLMYETDITDRHNLSIGASMNHDYYKENYDQQYLLESLQVQSSGIRVDNRVNSRDRETTTGLYAQYTYKLDDVFTLMAGLRYDSSNRYGGFWTPRVHVKYSPTEWFTVRASAGKGYRTPHALAENSPLFASSRLVSVDSNLKQEEAWNYGTSLNFNIPVGDKNLELNAEYYYTNFANQMVVNVKDNLIKFQNLEGKSYSHTVQVDATYDLFEGLSATAAWRFNDAQTTYDGVLRWRPLTNRYKGLLTLSYKTPLELWQFDVTGQFIGQGEKYDGSRYPSYGMLQAQITREFQYFSIYVGGENLTGYKMKEPIIGASNPWGPSFDATQVWGPTEGAMGYIGIRFKFEKF